MGCRHAIDSAVLPQSNRVAEPDSHDFAIPIAPRRKFKVKWTPFSRRIVQCLEFRPGCPETFQPAFKAIGLVEWAPTNMPASVLATAVNAPSRMLNSRRLVFIQQQWLREQHRSVDQIFRGSELHQYRAMIGRKAWCSHHGGNPPVRIEAHRLEQRVHRSVTCPARSARSVFQKSVEEILRRIRRQRAFVLRAHMNQLAHAIERHMGAPPCIKFS